jgi:hypothetical protein
MNEIQPTIVDPVSISLIAPALARDLAMDLLTIEEIAIQHNLDVPLVQRLLGSRTFRNMVDAAKAEWAAPGNAKNRAQLKAQLAVEEAIPDIFGIVSDAKEPAPARVAAFSQLREVGKFEKAPMEQSGRGGPGFSVTINLGEQVMTISGDAPQSTVEDAEEAIDGA